MSSSANDDQEQRKNTEMGDSNPMTIEFLRARLLSERSVSKAARQRADELAKRVAELEEQLRFVSVQRKKAEKATADVLAILENHGLSDLSEEFDSCSDQDETLHPLMANNGLRETSMSNYPKKNATKADSSSDLESSPSTGRGLSWKSSKDPKYSLERKKCTDSVRRRSSYASSGSSARRLGKSCRRIRRRETRTTEELQNDSTDNATSSRNVSNCSDGEPDEVKMSIGNDAEKNPSENPSVGSNDGNQTINENFSGHERDENMESALQHQAQLIGKYEEEEKAQREWEEKFRENNATTQDSCDPGIHSDVTEEQFEIKSTELLRASGSLCLNHRETEQEKVNVQISKPPQISNIKPDAVKENLKGEKGSGMVSYESSASEFSFPMSRDTKHQDFPRKQQDIFRSMPNHASAKRSSSHELAVVPQEKTPSNLGSVLEALEQAKLSLNQKLNSSHLVGEGTSRNTLHPWRPETNNVDGFQIPVGSRALFRLPTDKQIETNHSMGVRSSFDQISSEIAFNKFVSEPAVQSKSTFSSDLFVTAPQGLSNAGMRMVVPPQRSFSQPRMSVGPPSNRLSQVDPYALAVIPSNDYSYPFLPDITRRVPLSEGTARTMASSNTGMPTVTRLPLYDDLVRRPDMYR